jgi:glycosyltransferase involved in cell wall biosynthesis
MAKLTFRRPGRHVTTPASRIKYKHCATHSREVKILLTTKPQFLPFGADLANVKHKVDSPYQVVCVLRGSGFPYGAADAPRIINVGKALLSADVRFRVMHCGPSVIAANSEASGTYDGIPFEYTSLTTKRPRVFLLRALLYAWGFTVLTIRLLQLLPQRHSTCIYVYIQSGPIGVATAAICQVLGLPIVQEVNEWWPKTEGCSQFTKWLFRRPMFSLATGALVISTLIEERVRATAARLNHPLIVHRMPIIADLAKFKAANQPPLLASIDLGLPYFAWCGGVAGYIEDVFFMIRATGQVKQRGLLSQLVIVGPVDPATREQILKYAETYGVGGMVVLAGFVDDDQLQALYNCAAALLLPLWDDDRSKTRFPTKLSGYLASGTPVITCNVGDLTQFLENGKSAYIGSPGDEQDFARNMFVVLRDRTLARVIGSAGRRVCEAEIDYTKHSRQLADFFISCIRCNRE